jgi:hypothetical protein
LQAQLKTAQAHAKAKVFNRACKANPKEKLFLIPIAIGTNVSKNSKKCPTARLKDK